MREIHFLSLDRALSDIGAAITAMPFDIEARDDYVLTWRYSQAAADLHQMFHIVSDGRPKWLMHHPVTRRPIATETADLEGMALLEDLSGWFARHSEALGAFPHLRREHELTPEEILNSAYRVKNRLPRKLYEGQVGFDREQLIDYLDSPEVDIRHRITLPYKALIRRDERRVKRAAECERPVVDPPALNASIETAQTPTRVMPRLILPTNADAWAKSIAATFDLLVRESGDVPSGLEVWLRMNDRPPANYPISITKDHGLPAIALPGERPLTRDGFNKRWRRYMSET